ncbi:MAG TPA: two-component sensor histidine kinase [Alteromonas sp.]|nr:two-component sensor histidine kinase [Alteromonas sp.]|tara:strand:+ start:136 stop:1359 length:1224 start_codon:yes stop_codon:yes gene_type:complete
MTRLFVSFYLFMAVSLVLISSTLELIWPGEDYRESADMVLAKALLPLALEDQNQLLEKLRQAGIDYKLKDSAAINWSAAEQADLEAGLPVTLYTDTARFIYIPASERRLIVLSLPFTEVSRPYLLIYLSAFLLLLGVMLAIWLWPLWRDLAYLTRKVNHLGQESENVAIALKKRSVIQPIANKLNMLSERVHGLLRDQRELTGAVAHEFRTPIARLKFALEMKPEPDSQAWRGIQADLDELEGLVQEMLDYTQYDAMTPELNIADIPLNTLCSEVVARLALTTSKTLLVSGNEFTVRGDGHFIERAVINLLNNAIRHAKSQIIIEVYQTDTAINIAVNDDGTGVEPAQAARIFEPFFRPDNSRVRYAGGAGLGLAIVKRIQLWHAGTVSVISSNSLGGACFILSYPL